MINKEYDVIEFQGEYGLVRLHVPRREPTQKQIDAVYEAVQG